LPIPPTPVEAAPTVEEPLAGEPVAALLAEVPPVEDIPLVLPAVVDPPTPDACGPSLVAPSSSKKSGTSF
jgi:hypothetical protein